MTISFILQILGLLTQTVLLLSAVAGIFITMRHKLNHIHIDLNSRLSQLVESVQAQGHAEGMIEGRIAGVAATEHLFRVAGVMSLTPSDDGGSYNHKGDRP